jgi:type III restriction enzyme
MNDLPLLHNNIDLEFGKRDIKAVAVPKIIESNLNPHFPLRPYQKRAFQYFIKYWTEEFDAKPTSNQLLFHMATGSGKTLMMAGLMLYLYEQGYRNFLFFVNNTNIIDKTKDNFLNDISSKYLFSQNVTKDDRQIRIREVDNFQSTDENDINIVFSTIQGLHTRLNNPRENAITYDDFAEKKIVLISDEAHHINVETKAGLTIDKQGGIKLKGKVSVKERRELISWESTVNKIFEMGTDNILLEFTATIDFNNQSIANKYAPRLLFDYPLTQFRIDKYSKDVRVLQTDAGLFERALQAVILSQYRRKIFEKNKLLIKPIILIKSKTIAENKEFRLNFQKGIINLTADDLRKVKQTTNDDTLKRTFAYFELNKIGLENLVSEIKVDFGNEKLLIIDTNNDSVKKQLALNTLESPTNEYRAIFAVDKLNEGWDVLNLFDIVRLDVKRDARNNIPGLTTVREAQLIGRGARYCPFVLEGFEQAYKRKFDDNLEHEMRICEELYYHSTYNPKYIQELRTALVKTGIMGHNMKKRDMLVKPEFKKSEMYKSGKLYLNDRQKYDREDVSGLSTMIRNTLYQANLLTGKTMTENLFADQTTKGLERREETVTLGTLNKSLIRKAIDKYEFFEFANLLKHFPKLKSIDEFMTSSDYLGNMKVVVSGSSKQLESITKNDGVGIVSKVLTKLVNAIGNDQKEYQGSKKFKPVMINTLITDKKMMFADSESNDKEFGKSMTDVNETSIYLDLSNKSWYVYNDCFGTSEEKYLIKYIDMTYEKLSKQYDEVFLVRNERFFKLYNFDDGKPLEPDYVLFLRKNKDNTSMHYQVFIEPKGNHLLEKDKWKQSFLTSLKDEHKIDQIWKGRKYNIWGMPFYNHDAEISFHETFTKNLLT